MTDTYKAWFSTDGQGRPAFELREVPLSEPKAGEVRLRVRAASLNRGEFLHSPSYASAENARPAGSDVSGEIDAVGEGVTVFKPGDRVMGRARGAYAQYAYADPRLLSPIPGKLSWEEAAATPIVFNVTYDMLWTQGQLKRGEWLLVTGISSGVGVACLQAAKVIGAKVIGTSGSPAKLERLRELGLDVGIATRSPDFSSRVLEATGGKGVDLVVNNVGGSLFEECVRSMNYLGRLATVGYLDKTFDARIDLNAVHARRLRIFGVSARYRPVAELAESLANCRRDLYPALGDGRIRPVIDRVFPLEELPKAREYMEADAQVGKVVLKVQ
jgi:NADPH:quinone reductase-like Zn-dependent oxidoreductase